MTEGAAIDAVIRAVVFSLAALAWVVTLVRLSGARSLSKMTAFDFVVTLATGSLLASSASSSDGVAFVQAMAAMTVLIGAQVALTLARRSPRVRHLIENDPLLLMRDGAFIDRALKTGRVTRADLLAKLRQAGIADPREAAFVILEATGDIAILTARDVDAALLADVRGA